MNLRRFSAISALLLLLTSVALPQASAGVMTQQLALNGSFGSQGSLSINQFDSTLGLLNEIRLDYRVQGLAAFNATNPNPFALPVAFFDVTSSIALGPYSGGTLDGSGVAVFPLHISPSGIFATSGTGFAFLRGVGSSTVSDSATLDDFTSTGPGGVLNLSTEFASMSSAQVALSDVTSRISGQLFVTYLYEEGGASQAPGQDPSPNATVPEPASLAVLGFGALVMLRGRRRAKR